MTDEELTAIEARIRQSGSVLDMIALAAEVRRLREELSAERDSAHINRGLNAAVDVRRMFREDDLLRELDELRARCDAAERAAATAREERDALQSVWAMDTPYPLHDVLRILADAADHLLNDHNCDTHGYETITASRNAAREILRLIRARGGDR